MRARTVAMTRRFLLLQGPTGPFFATLARALRRHGYYAQRLRFNGGDACFGDGNDFRGTAAEWPAFIDAVLAADGITDLVLFGDSRPLHRTAIERARHLSGIAIHVFEEGYLRPGWITLEREGVNACSTLPRTVETYSGAARGLPETDESAVEPMPFFRRALEDMVYVAGTMLGRRRYPGYATHKPWPALAEYRAGAGRFFFERGWRQQSAAIAATLHRNTAPFFLFPLQLDSDAQIRRHSPFGAMGPAIEIVLDSFARRAPPDARLVISEHPLDHGVIDLRPSTLAFAARCGLSDRLHYLRGGTPQALVTACRGMVTVNSTMGLAALSEGRPVMVLAPAVYALPGLVHDGGLDDFWSAPQFPDAALFAAFRRVLISRTQLRGGYYAPSARGQALAGAIQRLCSPQADCDRGEIPAALELTHAG